MRILFIGDVVGSGGRKILKAKLPELKNKWRTDVCIANAENAAAGRGITSAVAREIFSCGVDVITLGNHTWSKHEFLDQVDDWPHLIRPANMPRAWPGRGATVFSSPAGKLIVINLLGRVYMSPADDPFVTADHLLSGLQQEHQTKMSIVDFHAEATAEKSAMAWYLDGRASAVIGTHTHVQTADERILDQGTAFISDVGMTGPSGGVIGMDRAASLRRLVDRLPSQHILAGGACILCAVMVEVDPKTGRANQIVRIKVSE
ncbi:MAG: TIGR00282 family metallophosphoesterase [Saccharofermentanales bacterium]|nr:TIGR00282 family metallophosphoesterase [Clostridiaceae bacterium]